MNRRSFCEGLIAAILTAVWPINRTSRQAAAFVSAHTDLPTNYTVAIIEGTTTGRQIISEPFDADEPLFTTLDRLEMLVAKQPHTERYRATFRDVAPRPRLLDEEPSKWRKVIAITFGEPRPVPLYGLAFAQRETDQPEVVT